MRLISSAATAAAISPRKTQQKTGRASQQEVKRPLAKTTIGGGNRMPSSRREPALFGNLRKESISPCIRSSGSGGGSGLDLDRLHVLKIRARDQSPSMSSITASNSTTAKDIKFSKYSALPAIKSSRPSLLREKTYDVLEPIFVKGPLHQDVKLTEQLTSPVENRIKLPEIKTNRVQTTKIKRTTQELSNSATAFNKRELPRAQTTSSVTTAQTVTATVSTTIRHKTGKIRQPFNPDQISKASMPESPTVFWFPA